MDPLRLDDLMISYAQHGEDVVLRRLFQGSPAGFYVDLGANDPLIDSVTKHFSLLGWRGVNVEPLAALHRRLVQDRPLDVNLCVAISNRPGRLVLEEVEGAHGLSTATEALAQAHREQGRTLIKREVPCLTLSELCERHCAQTTIDFLKIDVEGHEAQVLQGGDWKRFRPRVLLIESGWLPEAWHELVLSLGYQLGLDDGLNRFYIRAEDAPSLLQRLRWPANVNDRFIRADEARYVHLGRQWDALGPVVQSVAKQLAAVKDASPRLKAAFKRLLSLS